MRISAKEYDANLALLEKIWPTWNLLPELRMGQTAINCIYLAYGLRQKADQINLTKEPGEKELSTLDDDDNFFEVVEGKRVPYKRAVKGLPPLKVRGLNDEPSLSLGYEVQQSGVCWSGGVDGQCLDKY